jgi:hypothetical protein
MPMPAASMPGEDAVALWKPSLIDGVAMMVFLGEDRSRAEKKR